MTKKSSTILLAAFLLAGFGQAEAEPLIWGVELEEFEYRLGEPSDVLAWDGNAVFGTDEWKLRLRSEAAYVIDANEYETLESQLLVQHPVSTFFDVKAGVRLDAPKGRDQWFGVVGIEGLAPQWLEVDANLFVSEEGDLSARLGLEYELLITNFLILRPTAEVDMAFSEDRDREVYSGLTKAEIGARLSYDLLDRNLSPYIGVHFEKKLGSTADEARASGEQDDAFYAVTGVRLMF